MSIRVKATAAIAVAALSAPALAGPLTPPAGAPAPTNKTLQQVEPRTPIASTGAQINISQPGSYYLVEDLVTGASGLQILTGGVTIDFNGFAIVGDPLAAGQFGVNVSAASDQPPVILRNGAVRDIGGNGVQSSLTTVLIAERLSVSNCNTGFEIVGAARLIDCTARANIGDGFDTRNDAILERCLADTNGGDGFDADEGVLNACIARNNAGSGFFLGRVSTFELGPVLTACAATRNAADGFNATTAATFRACKATDNTDNGFNMAGDCALAQCVSNDNDQSGFAGDGACAFETCLATANAGDGIVSGPGSTAANCIARDNAIRGFLFGDGSKLTACSASNNGSDGYLFGDGVNVSYSAAYANGLDGFELGFDNQIAFCSADEHANGAGIKGASDCAIDSNTTNDNDVGILSGDGSLLIRNRAAMNNTNFSTGLGTFGTILSPGAGVFVTSEPFANIEY